MKYLLRGNLCGYLCRNISEPLEGVQILLYSPWKPDRVTENAVARTKDTFRLVGEEEKNERKSLLIAKAQADSEGNFEFDIDEKYARTAFDIDIVCSSVPKMLTKPKERNEVQFHITTIYPEWRYNQELDVSTYYWNYCISEKWWCYIRGHYFDAWVIVGHVTVCDTKNPIPDLKVIAMDADFLTDDNLGSDVTDANGFFRIDYNSMKFKNTFLSPWLNIETDPGLTFNSGPDVYFNYEYNSLAVSGERAADRRNNVNHCLCVSLCLSDIDIPDPIIPASFTKIGNNGDHFINETIASGDPNVIAAATGKTPAGQAFFSCIKLRGNLSKKLNNVAMEYSFDTIETNGPGGSHIGSWEKVKAHQTCNAVIGTFFTLTGDPDNPIFIIDHEVGPSGGIEPDGWIKVPQAGNFAPNINGELLGFRTDTLNGATVDMAGLVQGQSTTTVMPLQQNRFFKIRMRKRQVGNAATEVTAGVSNAIAMFNTVYNNVPQFGSWMPTTSNEMGVACIDVQQLIGGGGGSGCTPITANLDVNYTAANPNMGGVSLVLYGPGGPYSIQNVSPVGNVPETFGTASELHIISDGSVKPVGDLDKCAYTVWFSAALKLTNGESQHSSIDDWLSFCKS